MIFHPTSTSFNVHPSSRIAENKNRTTRKPKPKPFINLPSAFLQIQRRLSLKPVHISLWTLFVTLARNSTITPNLHISNPGLELLDWPNMFPVYVDEKVCASVSISSHRSAYKPALWTFFRAYFTLTHRLSLISWWGVIQSRQLAAAHYPVQIENSFADSNVPWRSCFRSEGLGNK